MRQTPRVFISYARKDGEAFAMDLKERIEVAKIPVWRDREGMRGGEGWWSQIEHVLDQVEFMVVVMTPGAVASVVVRKEWHHARRKGLCVFPVLASDALPWASFITQDRLLPDRAAFAARLGVPPQRLRVEVTTASL